MDTLMDESEEAAHFDKTLSAIIDQVTSYDIASPNSKLVEREISVALNWFREVIKYNLPHGKRNRGMAVVMSHKILGQHLNLPVDLNKARIIGWCIEILQAHFLILDDIMDESITRRGQKCWHLKRNVGSIAINDSFFMQMSIFYLIDKYFASGPSQLHTELTRLFHTTMLRTVIGQNLDLLSSAKPGQRPDFNLFTLDKYNTIVDYKTAIYSFSTPVRLGLILTGVYDSTIHEHADNILRQMGQFFQIQDDFLDCFGDPVIMGKIGTDIEEGKCCWPIVTALPLANESQRAILEANYSLKDASNSAKVKEVYRELKLEEIYRQYEKESISKLCESIDKFSKQTDLPGEIFYSLLLKICGRTK